MSLNRSRLVKRAAPVDNIGLQGLLTNTTAVYGLMAYLDSEIASAEDEFNKTAGRAVFEPGVAVWAAQKQGVCEGLRRVRTRMEQLLETGE